MKERDRSKLPQWAQRELQRLEADLESWKKQATAGPENSNTFIDHFEDRKPLGDSPDIVFTFGDGDWYQRFQVRIDGEELLVQTSEQMQLLSKSMNRLTIRIGR